MPLKSKQDRKRCDATHGKAKYQLLAALRPDERASLRADIARRGVMVAVEKDEDGNILDGHHRAAIAGELGIDYPVIVRTFASEQAKREHVIKLNLARRHLDPIRWGQAFALLLEGRGVHTARGPKPDEAISDTVSEIAAELGVHERTARRRLEKARAYEALPVSERLAVDEGTKTLPQAKRSVENDKKQRQLATKAAEAKQHLNGEPPWEIVTGDCLAELKKLRAGSVRLVFADPPYNIGVDYGHGAAADRLADHAYLEWAEAWVRECISVLTDDGSLWVLIGDEYAAEYAVAVKRQGYVIRAWVKWYETFGVNNANNFNRCSRHLFYCVKDPKRFVFHPSAVRRPSDRQAKYADARAVPGGKVWDDVWQIPRLVGTAKERLPDFPTQLPLALLLPVVGCASDPGDLIVDPFGGSGTTGEAALRLGRRYVGIEQSAEYAVLARRRLLAVQGELRCREPLNPT
jgi:site-specific DNA-methyltransferase (adenine-specific)